MPQRGRASATSCALIADAPAASAAKAQGPTHFHRKYRGAPSVVRRPMEVRATIGRSVVSSKGGRTPKSARRHRFT
jgi:hypothetical protein